MSTETELLFRDYWDDPERSFETQKFSDLQKHVNDLVKNDSDMDWMDDPKTALIVHHVLRIEEDKKFFYQPLVQQTLIRMHPFLLGYTGRMIVGFDTGTKVLLPQQTHGLVNEPLPVAKLRVFAQVGRRKENDLFKERYEEIELFLERERNLVNDMMIVTLYPATYYEMHEVTSCQSGSWIYRENEKDHEGSLSEIADMLLDKFDSVLSHSKH